MSEHPVEQSSTRTLSLERICSCRTAKHSTLCCDRRLDSRRYSSRSLGVFRFEKCVDSSSLVQHGRHLTTSPLIFCLLTNLTHFAHYSSCTHVRQLYAGRFLEGEARVMSARAQMGPTEHQLPTLALKLTDMIRHSSFISDSSTAASQIIHKYLQRTEY